MLPKTNRLPKPEFLMLSRTGKRIQTSFFTLYIRNNSLLMSRFGISVGKKVSLLAHVRNRIKRLIRESLYHLLSKFTHGMDCLIVVKQSMEGKSQIDVENEIQQLLIQQKFISS